MSFFSWDCVEGHYWTHDEAMQTAFFFFFLQPVCIPVTAAQGLQSGL